MSAIKIPVRHEMPVLKNARACVTYSKLFCCCHFSSTFYAPNSKEAGEGVGAYCNWLVHSSVHPFVTLWVCLVSNEVYMLGL